MEKRFGQGQVGLILLIVMGVVIALAMSLASRSLSDTVLSRQEQESSTAFRMAESGVESALNSIRTGNVSSGSTQQSNGIFSGSYNVVSQGNYSLFVREGETANLDLTGYDTSKPLVISWTKKADKSENHACVGEGSGNAPAGMEIKALNATTLGITYAYYNPAGCTISGNNFLAAATGTDPYLSKVSYTVVSGTTSLRLKPIYSDATIQVAGDGIVATQLYLIQSTASGGDAQKDIQVQRGIDSSPSIFDYALFSGTTIIK